MTDAIELIDTTGAMTMPMSASITSFQTPQYLRIVGEGGRTVVTVYFTDGHVEYGEGITPDEAARLFWEGVGKQAMGG